MGVTVRVETKNLDELRRALSPSGIDRLLLRAGFEAEGLAKSAAPVDTGFLRGSLSTVASGPGEVTIGASAGYAPFIEYGTRRMKAQPFLEPAVKVAGDHLKAALEVILRKAGR